MLNFVAFCLQLHRLKISIFESSRLANSSVIAYFPFIWSRLE